MWKLDNVFVQHHIKLAGFQPFDPQLVQKDKPEGVASGKENDISMNTIFTKVNQQMFTTQNTVADKKHCQENWNAFAFTSHSLTPG